MERPAVRRELPLLLELSGLCGLAVALPALGVLGHSPDFLVLERLDASDLVLLAAVVALVPPLALEAAGLLAGLAGPRARRAAHLATVAGTAPIVVVAVDELPLTSLLDTSGRVDPATYPSFAWLAGHSTWYRNATAVTQWTRDAFPAMLTGRYPSRALPPHHRSYPDNLFTLLDGPYQLDVHETSTMLCPRH